MKLRRAIALTLMVVGLIACGLGIASATLWRMSDTLTATHTLNAGSSAAVADPGVMEIAADTVTIHAISTNESPVVLAIGRDTDVAGWVGSAAVEHLTGLAHSGTALTGPGVKGDGQLPSAAGSDLWIAQDKGNGSATLEWKRQPGRWSLLVSAERQSGGAGEEVKLEMTWPQVVTTPYLIPLVAAGAALMVLGLIVLLVDQRARRRAKAAIAVGAGADGAVAASRAPGRASSRATTRATTRETTAVTTGAAGESHSPHGGPGEASAKPAKAEPQAVRTHDLTPPAPGATPAGTPVEPGSMGERAASPGAVPVAGPDSMPGSMPGSMSGSMRGGVPGAVPGAAPTSVPGAVPTETQPTPTRHALHAGASLDTPGAAPAVPVPGTEPAVPVPGTEPAGTAGAVAGAVGTAAAASAAGTPERSSLAQRMRESVRAVDLGDAETMSEITMTRRQLREADRAKPRRGSRANPSTAPTATGPVAPAPTTVPTSGPAPAAGAGTGASTVASAAGSAGSGSGVGSGAGTPDESMLASPYAKPAEKTVDMAADRWRRAWSVVPTTAPGAGQSGDASTPAPAKPADAATPADAAIPPDSPGHQGQPEPPEPPEPSEQADPSQEGGRS